MYAAFLPMFPLPCSTETPRHNFAPCRTADRQGGSGWRRILVLPWKLSAAPPDPATMETS